MSGLGIFLLCLLTAGLVYVNKPKEKTHILWSLFCLSVALWGGGLFFGFTARTYHDALFWARTLNVFPIFIPTFFIHFLLEFLKHKKRNKILPFVYITNILLVFSSLAFPHLLIKDVSSKLNFIYYPDAGTLFYALALFFVICVNLGFYILIRKLQKTKFKDKSLRVLFYAMLIGFLGGSTTFPLVFDIYIYPYGTVAPAIFAIIVGYAITKYELLDIKLVVSKATSFFIATTVAVGTTVFVHTLTFSNYFLNLVSVIGSIVFWSFFHPKLFLLIYTPIEKKFLKGFYNIQEIISSLSTELLISKNQISILKTIAEKLMNELETKEPFFIFSHLNEDGYKLYNLNSDKPSYSIEYDEDFTNYFDGETEPIRAPNLPAPILRYISPLALPEKSLIFPIQSIEKFHGLFIFTEKLNGSAYSENDIAMIKAVFNQLMIVFDRIVYQRKIENMNQSLEKRVEDQVKEIEEKRKIEVDLNVANDIQQLLLPERLPQITNYAFDAMFKPAKSISGDYYDFFMFSETKIGVVIADVAGKGIPAALLMANLKSVIAQHVSSDKSPVETIRQLNVTICESRVFKKHIPVVYGILDTQKNTFTYCNAGHDPGKHYSKGKVTLLDKGGIPLGLYEDEEYEQEMLTLSKNDFVTFYTDGIPDARNRANEGFGEDQVDSIIRQYIEKPSGGSFTEILQSYWLPFVGSMPLKDDTTLVSIYFCPQKFQKK